MKTTHIISLFAAAMSLIFATTASAVPASKRVGSGKSAIDNRSTTSTPVVHKVMKRVGPPGKGYVCTR
jgi:hypothetical protein